MNEAFNYKINNDVDVPIYEQLVDMVKSDIVSGRLEFGAKLPTVRDLSDSCSIARGTVMRAYDELENQGYIEKVQGRGTTVCYKPGQPADRKNAAMESIDAMLDKLFSLGFSESEIGIFVDLKLREREDTPGGVKITVVECNSEVLLRISEQVRNIGNVDVYAFTLDEILAYPYRIPEDTELVVISAKHAEEAKSVLPTYARVVKAALKLEARTVFRIASIKEGSNVGILTRSERFGDLLVEACSDYAGDVQVSGSETFLCDVPSYLRDKDVLLVPRDYGRFCDGKTCEQIKDFARDKTLIQCEYRIDDGSMIYIEDEVRALREQN